MKISRFKEVASRPRWEGIIFPDLNFEDPRLSVRIAEPSNSLKDHIECLWLMKWNLKEGEKLPYILVPNPCTKIVALRQSGLTYPPLLVGARTEAMIAELSGEGTTIGFDFKPGALFKFTGTSMENLVTTEIQANKLFVDLPTVPKENWNEANLTRWFSEMEDFLSHLSVPDKNNYQQIFTLMDKAISRELKSPDEMANSTGLTVRSLQRIFHDEVGISPRDLLRIIRFNEAIQKISQDDFMAFVDVALESGFFDQPHMVNEFRKLVATSPKTFRRYL